MKLQVPFVQLPLKFDAEALAREISALDEHAWRPHPQGYPGNSALPLVAVDGDPASDALRGPMAPTPFLGRCPYLMQALASLDVVIGRTRLMRLAGQAEVSPHVDTAYYWWQRVRVHVPIVTQPTVRFNCGDAEVNMAAGECWIFDTWRMHRVLNDAERSRVHLVVDTVGGDGFTTLLMGGRPHNASIKGWHPRVVAPQSETPLALRFEKRNLPTVMTPWEVREYLLFLLNETLPHPQLQLIQSSAARLDRQWQALWACHGDDPEGWPHYRRALDAFLEQMQQLGAADALLRNGTTLNAALSAGLARAALADVSAATEAGEPREVLQKAAARPRAPEVDEVFDRPVFIVSSPRSGSTLLFETLAKAPGVFTIGEESHALIEGISELHPAARDFDSNRLLADAATLPVLTQLRTRFREALIDRDGARPPDGRIRMLEKTPKNSLRIPFLARVFPKARFIYLYRDPRQTLASMIEAWQSGRFRTYPQLPGWTGPTWSLLLTPGWRELVGKPLHEIVGAQWESTTRILLDDLTALLPERVCVARYDALLADPQAEITRMCAAVGFAWDTTLSTGLPPSQHTLSAPAPDKWRRHAQEIEAVLPQLAPTIARAERFAER